MTSSGMFKFTVPLFCFVLLSGCAAAIPAEALKTDLISAEAIAQQYDLDTRWWMRYNDQDLNATIDLALERNIDLAKAAIDVNKALYQAKLIGSDLLPTFSADGSASGSKDLSGEAGTRHSYASELAVGYEIDLWRRLRLAASAEEWTYRATLEDMESARLALINTVADTWFELRYLEDALAVTAETVQRYARMVELLRIKYDLGKVDSVEPLQAEQALLSAQNRLLDLQTRQSSARQIMRDLLNLHPDQRIPTCQTPIMDIHSVPVDLNVPVAALSARPDIRAAEARLRSAFDSLESEKASWFPTISIGSSLGLNASSGSTFFDAPTLGGLVSITFPFLDWNRLRWSIRISESDFKTATLDFTSSVTTALNEVNAAYTAWTNTGHSLTNLAAQHEKDLAIVSYYQARYDLGAAELKDYLDALNTADTSALSLLETRYQWLSLENSIYKAMGGRYTAKISPAPETQNESAPTGTPGPLQ